MTAICDIQPIVSGVRFVSGGPHALADTVAHIGASRGDLTVELYQAADAEYAAALLDHVRGGHGLDVLANANLARTPGGIVPATLLDDLESSGADVATYAAGSSAKRPPWLHTKVVHDRDPQTGAVTSRIGNLAASPESLARNEVTTIVDGAPAKSALAVTDAARTDDPVTMRAAALHAAGNGVLVNDSRSGSYVISDVLAEMVTTARAGTTLRIITKTIDDAEWSTLIAEAASRGVHVDITVRDLAPADAAILRESGATVEVVAASEPSLRINYVENDGRAYLGTAFFWHPMLDPAGGTSRDMGLLFAGDALEQVRAEVDGQLAQMSPGVSLDEALASGQLKGVMNKPMTVASAEQLGLHAPAVGANPDLVPTRGAASIASSLIDDVETALAQVRAVHAGGDGHPGAAATHGDAVLGARLVGATSRLHSAATELADLRRLVVAAGAGLDAAAGASVAGAGAAHASAGGIATAAHASAGGGVAAALAGRLGTDLVWMRTAERSTARIDPGDATATARLTRTIADAHAAVDLLTRGTGAASEASAALLDIAPALRAASDAERATVTTAAQARAFVQASQSQLARLDATLAHGAVPAGTEPVEMLGDGSNFHGRIPVHDLHDPAGTGVATRALVKSGVDGAQEAWLQSAARALGLGHLYAPVATRADGTLAVQRVAGRSMWRAGVRKAPALEDAIAAWYRTQFPSLPADQAQSAARIDRQLAQFVDHLVANPDRNSMNGLVDAPTKRVTFIDGGFAGRGATADPTVTYLKQSYQGAGGTTTLDPDALGVIRTQLTDDVLAQVHQILQAPRSPLAPPLPADWAARLAVDASDDTLAAMRARRDAVLATGSFSYLPQRLADSPLSHEVQPGRNA